MLNKLHLYIEKFNSEDNELYKNLIPNSDAEQFLAREIPYIDCPDKCIEEIYYFRWWTFRKHIKETEDGHVITEFLPQVQWSGKHNTINCPACFHIREGRWLKDDGKWLKEYVDFWLSGKGSLHSYSSWFAHAVLEYCTHKNDFDYAVQKLPELITFFEKREKTNGRNGGIYWSDDDCDGMEYSISGPGLRPTINSYAWADAKAIAKIAEMAGRDDIKLRFECKVNEIKKMTDALLWDGKFYKTVPLGENETVIYTARPEVSPHHNAKELIGYVPWYFSMPDTGKDAAFAELLHSDGFFAKFGLTTAEQRHSRFMENHSHECLWNGPVWPYATSQVLVALSNLLHYYQQSTVTKRDYYTLLRQYADSHRMTKENGSTVAWIDENMHPYTGIWLARSILINGDGVRERGKDYNHSLFCDLVLSGLFGISVENGSFVSRPLVPDDWEYFKVENLWLCGSRYRVNYERGKGTTIEKY